MRKQRLKELKEYEKTLEAIGDLKIIDKSRLVAKKKALLNLELPFKTDSVSLMGAYEKTFPPKADWSSKEHASNSGLPAEERWQRNSFFKALYKQKILPIFYQVGDETFEVPVEDFHLEPIYRLLKERIQGSDQKDSMKKKQCSQLNSLRSHQQKGFARVAAERNGSSAADEIDIFLLSGFFEYLEDQFLETGSGEDLQNLVSIRLAFYVDAPIRALAQIKFADIQYLKENWYLISTEKYSQAKGKFIKKSLRLRFPSFYFELLQEGFKGSPDVIFPFSEKEFYKRVRSLFSSYQSESKASANFSPKMLRRTLAQICSGWRFPLEFLPAR